MRRIIPAVIVMLSFALLATGCDFFRVLAGRPTSKEIAAKRELIKRQEDSLRLVAKPETSSKPIVSDQPAATDQPSATAKPEVTSKPETAAKPAAAASEGKVSPGAKAEKKRFYVIMGTFSSKDNAERYAAKLREKGLEPEFFGFKEGHTAVGVGGTDDQDEAKAYLADLKRQDFCPSGAWIIDRKRK